MAGEKNWVFWTSGAHIVSGFEQCATDGFVGVDADGVVYLFDNNQNVFASAHASDIESYVSKSGVRLFPYYLLTYIMPPLYKP